MKSSSLIVSFLVLCMVCVSACTPATRPNTSANVVATEPTANEIEETVAANVAEEGPVESTPAEQPPSGTETATFASGCFWCTEAFFERLEGVKSVVSGYSGGTVDKPTYYQVCSGRTGHAEAVQVTYDPSVVTYPELLEVFWKIHDPTTLNRQGNDVGTQYRSAVFYHNEQQREQAEHYKKKLDEAGAFDDPIVTEITAFTNFYSAETDHQDFFTLNPRQPYCSFVIRPKMDKFEKAFHDKLKSDTP